MAASFSAAAAAARWSSLSRFQLLARRSLPFSAVPAATAPLVAAASFGWEDALRVAANGGRGDESDLSGYFRKVDTCNRGMLSFYLHRVKRARLNASVWILLGFFRKKRGSSSSSWWRIKLWGTSTTAYGVHMNGYVEKEGQTFLWIAKRSDTKQTFPGMLDHLVAGGLPYGISCEENVIKNVKRKQESQDPSQARLLLLERSLTWILKGLDTKGMFSSAMTSNFLQILFLIMKMESLIASD